MFFLHSANRKGHKVLRKGRKVTSNSSRRPWRRTLSPLR
ncbi:MAG: hypothetical protein J5I65_10425 [Aridibacter famidurans]|nr:hypothetical protein [Aridibacter famidurans]